MRQHIVFFAGLALLAASVPALSQTTASTPAYCQQQRRICLTLCNQATTSGTAKRNNCDAGCDQSVHACLTSGSYNFAPVEQYMPEFHKQ